MKTSTTNNHKSRSMFATLSKIATAVAFGGLLCALPLSSLQAAPHHDAGHGGYHGGGHPVAHGGYHGGYHGGHWGGGYYAPGPDIYVAPEPYAYGAAPCYGPYYEENCGPPPPSGVSLFFGL